MTNEEKYQKSLIWENRNRWLEWMQSLVRTQIQMYKFVQKVCFPMLKTEGGDE